MVDDVIKTVNSAHHVSSTTPYYTISVAIFHSFSNEEKFFKWILLFLGATVCRGGKTVCGCLRALGMKGEAAFATYNHLLPYQYSVRFNIQKTIRDIKIEN